ncbi:hypothetical protein [Aquimarina algicola]|uniref:Uncharacterized protein n=1 Tax=Aquimarina algicola TaxID=2589995 RepID=A0A504JBI1_9FLAO|nr:hypothetical protein [Aquimarina algicola]TPN85218.1 hypothetical protein FHK87_14410 [Aquimarina algicola]
MRIIFSIILFLSFAVRPVIEISTVMYYQLNINTIVEKYCVNKERPRLKCNGKCYLMSQMKANTQPSKKNSNTIVITEAFIPLFFQDNAITIENNSLIKLAQVHNWKIKYFYLNSISKDIDHPPENILS